MIKIFEKSPDSWESKMNAVDDQNRLVGYDLNDDCCAHGGYFVSNKIETEEQKEPKTYDLSAYHFDETFFEEIPEKEYESYQAIAFKMIADGKEPLYLHLYNCHNGYYSKGFTASFGEHKEGSV